MLLSKFKVVYFHFIKIFDDQGTLHLNGGAPLHSETQGPLGHPQLWTTEFGFTDRNFIFPGGGTTGKHKTAFVPLKADFTILLYNWDFCKQNIRLQIQLK